MRTVEIRITEAVLRQAQDLALSQNMTAEQVLSMAVTEAIAAWTNKQRVDANHRIAGRQQFLEMLQEVLDAERPELRVPHAALTR